MRELEAPLLGLSTSGFRISLITREAYLDTAVRKMHATFLERGESGPLPFPSD
jgi:hypothetical protein